jgi:hypothetical protein
MGFTWKIAAMLCALPLLMGADIYRWVDADGVVNYSQLKPEGVNAELVDSVTGERVVRPAPPPAAEPATGAAGGQDPQLTDSQQQMLAELQAAERARQAEVARIKEANCQRARDVLQRLTVVGRIRVRDEDGQERVLPEEERQQRIAEAQRGIAANCSDTASR